MEGLFITQVATVFDVRIREQEGTLGGKGKEVMVLPGLGGPSDHLPHGSWLVSAGILQLRSAS